MPNAKKIGLVSKQSYTDPILYHVRTVCNPARQIAINELTYAVRILIASIAVD